MKKVCLVLQEKTSSSALKKLRQAGVVHIHKETGVEVPAQSSYAERAILEKAQEIINPFRKKSSDKILSKTESLLKAKEIIALNENKNELLENISTYVKNMEFFKPWGDFNPADIHYLNKRDVDIRLINVSKKNSDALNDNPYIIFFPMSKSNDGIFAAAIYLNQVEDPSIVSIPLPEHGLSELEELVSQMHKEVRVIQQKIIDNAVYHDAIEQGILVVQEEIEFETVVANFTREEELVGIFGFVPLTDVDALKKLASQESWGLMLSEPSEEEAVPTLIKNPPAIRIIQPIFNLMGITPGYREMDISLWFLSFLSIFVAMILGDAAYGTLILIAVAVLRWGFKKHSDTLWLITIFGIITFLWGAVTGTWFSSLSLVRDTPLRHVVIPALATYQQELFPNYSVNMALFPGSTMDATAMVKWISLLLGGIMISIARIQSFFRLLPSIRAIAQIGWLSIVIALYWLIMNFVLQLSLLSIIQQSIPVMLLGGIVLVLIFGCQKRGKPFRRGLLEGLKDILPTMLNAIGTFGDIISFIRLFAVGLAGVALSQSFNTMIPKGHGSVVIVAILILVLGHSLNFALNALSVLVHGVRLNILEFSGHLDMEWAGIKFEPFRLHCPRAESSEKDKE